MIADFTLPQRPVLDFPPWPIVRWADRERPSRSFCTAIDVVLHLAQYPAACRAGGAMHSPGSDRLRPVRPSLISTIAFNDHVRYLDAFIRARRISSAYLVAQDWGTALAFHLAARRPDSSAGSPSWEFIRPIRHGMTSIRCRWMISIRCRRRAKPSQVSERRAKAERMILDGNAFVRAGAPSGMIRMLSEEEMRVYRGPSPRRNRGALTWRLPNELPIAGEPADVYATSNGRTHARFLPLSQAGCSQGIPARVVSPPCREFCRRPARLRGRPARRGRSLSPRRSSGDDRPIHAAWITRIEERSGMETQHESCATCYHPRRTVFIGGYREMSAR